MPYGNVKQEVDLNKIDLHYFSHLFISLALYFLCSGCHITKSQKALTQTQQVVTVSNTTDFINAIAPNTTIYLEPGEYHLEKYNFDFSSKYLEWAMVLFDEIYIDSNLSNGDKTLLIKDISNLTIIGLGTEKDSVKILTNRKNASVLAFKHCDNISLDNIVLGHDISNKDILDPYVSYCSGEVLEFFDCDTLAIHNSVLFGCGTRGFLMHRCNEASINNNIIKECSYGAFGVFNSKNITVSDCIIRNNNFRTLIEIENSFNIHVKKTSLSDNSLTDTYNCQALKIDDYSGVVFEALSFKNNDFSPIPFNAFSLEREK